MSVRESFPRILYLQENNANYDDFIASSIKEYMLNSNFKTVSIRPLNEYASFLKIIEINQENYTFNIEDKHKNISFSVVFIINEFAKFEFNKTVIQDELVQLINEYIINQYNEEIKKNIVWFIKTKLYTFNLQFKLLEKTLKTIKENLKIEYVKSGLNYLNMFNYYVKKINEIIKEFNYVINEKLLYINPYFNEEIKKVKEIYDINSLPHRLIDDINFKNIISYERKNITYVSKLDCFLREELGIQTEGKNCIETFSLLIEELNIFKKQILTEYTINNIIDCKYNMKCCFYIDTKIDQLKTKIQSFL